MGLKLKHYRLVEGDNVPREALTNYDPGYVMLTETRLETRGQSQPPVEVLHVWVAQQDYGVPA